MGELNYRADTEVVRRERAVKLTMFKSNFANISKNKSSLLRIFIECETYARGIGAIKSREERADSVSAAAV